MDTSPLPHSSPEVSSPAPRASDPLVLSPLPAREFPVREVFVGPNGLYPGTRWLMYLLMGGILLAILGVIVHYLHPHQGGPVWWGMVSEFIVMIAAIVPGFVMAGIEKRPFGDFGLPANRAFRRNFWVGVVWGFVSLSVLMLALRLAGAFELGSLGLHGFRIAKFATYYAVYFMMVGLFEEFLLRGYSQWVLSQGMHFWPTAALLSFGFGALHGANSGESRIGLMAAGLIGFFFCLTLRRTGNLWWAVGFHMSWDWGESFFYSVPDSGTTTIGHLFNSSYHGPTWLSGGSVGPEGSVLAFGIIVLLWVAFDRIYPEVRYFTEPGKQAAEAIPQMTA